MIKVDAHQHFWQLNRGDYDWLTPQLASIYQDFLPEHLQPILNTLGIDKTVLVQAAATVKESYYLLKLADKYDFVAGVVGWIDMESDQALETLSALQKSSYLLGIRPLIQDLPDIHWMLKPVLEKVFIQLIEQGLTFDALVYPRHLNNLLTLLERYPTLKVVIDHGAKPDIANACWEPWADNMARIARYGNVYCKLSGLLTQALPNAQDHGMSMYMNTLLDSFGPNRLMWGSDWPVLNLAADYEYWYAMCERFLHNYSEKDAAAIFGGNACRFYGLDAINGRVLRKR